MNGDTEISVTCVGDAGAWDCAVRVSDARGATDHKVVVTEIDLPAVLADADLERVEGAVRETFVFLLEREPKESILRRFDLSVVGRYFPEYEDELARRLGR